MSDFFLFQTIMLIYYLPFCYGDTVGMDNSTNVYINGRASDNQGIKNQENVFHVLHTSQGYHQLTIGMHKFTTYSFAKRLSMPYFR